MTSWSPIRVRSSTTEYAWKASRINDLASNSHLLFSDIHFCLTSPVPMSCARDRLWQVERIPGAVFLDSNAFHLPEPITRNQCYEKCMDTGKRDRDREPSTQLEYANRPRDFLRREKLRVRAIPHHETPVDRQDRARTVLSLVARTRNQTVSVQSLDVQRRVPSRPVSKSL